jgi:hypothetical protein
VVDSTPFELCEEFNKLKLRIVTNTEAGPLCAGNRSKA